MNLPHYWVVIKITNIYGVHHRVFATWSGGYSAGDSWRLNSGITEVTRDDDYYYFHGASGSCYKCAVNAYGVANSYGQSVLDDLLQQEGAQLEENQEDWVVFLKDEV
jgi:hypothetical protein